jgi:TetR/AcrR family transcriptional repressor of nem operon
LQPRWRSPSFHRKISIDTTGLAYILVGMLTAPKPAIRRIQRRNSERARERLLQSAFSQIYKSGFQGSDIDTIIDAAGVTKGALYHHFDSKEELGYAVVDEVIAGITLEKWVRPLQNPVDPIVALIAIVESTSLSADHVRGGCPLNNLAQEMSPLDEGFRKRLAKVFEDWLAAIAGALRDGQRRGLVRADIDAKDMAGFLIATYEGYISLSKSSQDPQVLESGKRNIARFLQSLRAPRKRKQRPNV